MEDNNTEQQTEIVNPFPSFIYKTQLDIDVEKICAKVKTMTAENEDWRLWLSHFTHPNLAEYDKEFADIADMIRIEADKFYSWSKNLNKTVSIMQTKRMWFNIYRNGGHMRPHDHYECYYGSSLYLQNNEENCDIVFTHPSQIKFNTTHVERPKPGTLLIWPGWMLHEVPPNPTNEERILLSAKIDYKVNHFGLDNRRIDEDLLENVRL